MTRGRRGGPRLIDKLVAREDLAQARLLPGYDTQGLDTVAGSNFVIAPDKQLDACAQHLQATGGPSSTLVRLYGRDFWMP